MAQVMLKLDVSDIINGLEPNDKYGIAKELNDALFGDKHILLEEQDSPRDILSKLYARIDIDDFVDFLSLVLDRPVTDDDIQHVAFETGKEFDQLQTSEPPGIPQTPILDLASASEPEA